MLFFPREEQKLSRTVQTSVTISAWGEAPGTAVFVCVAAQLCSFHYKLKTESGKGFPPEKKASDPLGLQESLPVGSPASLFCVVPSVRRSPVVSP